jgi:hypothetical protein
MLLFYCCFSLALWELGWFVKFWWPGRSWTPVSLGLKGSDCSGGVEAFGVLPFGKLGQDDSNGKGEGNDNGSH